MCLSFDGQNDYVLLPVQDLTGKSEITLEAWINPDPNITQHYQNILRQNGQGIPAAFLMAYQNLGTDLSFGLNTTAGYVELDHPVSTSQFTGTWSHVACVYDGDLMRLYINGLLVDSTNQNGVMDFSVPSANFIGRRSFGSPIEPYRGLVDEVRIWNVARTQQEIFLNMNCALSGPLPGLLAVYNLNSTSGLTAFDASGNGSAGILQSGPVWVNSPVAPVCAVGFNEPDVKEGPSIYPNPVTDQFSILVENEATGSFSIFDSSGKLVVPRKLLDQGVNTFSIPNKLRGVFTVVFYNDITVTGSRMILVDSD